VNGRGASLAAHRRTSRVVRGSAEEAFMKYGVAWLIGVPPILIVGWFLLNHC
jgi:hypothetical protein